MVFVVNGNRWSVNGLSVLNILSLDFDDVSTVSSISGVELGDNSEWLGSVDSELASWSIEVLISVSEGSEITSIFVADSLESFTCGVITALCSFTSVLCFSARMGSECLGNAVCFPNVEFHTA